MHLVVEDVSLSQEFDPAGVDRKELVVSETKSQCNKYLDEESF